jgi:hypothetical protein
VDITGLEPRPSKGLCINHGELLQTLLPKSYLIMGKHKLFC